MRSKSIRPFVGAKDFAVSRRFYQELGFQEHVIAPNLSLFEYGNTGFYLQDAYVKDWIDNTMVFLEVSELDRFWEEVAILDLSSKFENVRLVPIISYDWGREFFIYDPSGVLWHIGSFAE